MLYLFAVALFAAIDFGFYGFMAVSYLPRVPVALLIGLGIVVFGTGMAILIGIYYLFFPPKRKTLGVILDKNEEKILWNVLEEVANEIKARPINKIIITPEVGIGVYLEGNIFLAVFGGGRRVLEIGLPSLHELSIDEFKAILAHEYGHFSNKDTQWTPFTYAMGNSLISTLRATPGPSESGNQDGSWVRGIISLNPAYWLLLLFVKLFSSITSGFSRIREVMADIYSMELYGGKAFHDGLLKIATNDTVFREIIESKYVPDLLKEGKTISNFSFFMEVVYKSLDKKDIDSLQSNIVEINKNQGVFDSHPALKNRLFYSEKFISKEEKNKKLVSTIFDNWENINKKVADLYNLKIINYLQTLQKQEEKVIKK